MVGAFFVVRVTRREEVIDDEVGNSIAENVTLCKVKAEMLSSENTA